MPRAIPSTDSGDAVNTNHLLAVFNPSSNDPQSQRITDVIRSLFTADLEQKLNGIAAGAQVNLTGNALQGAIDTATGSTAWRTNEIADNSIAPAKARAGSAAQTHAWRARLDAARIDAGNSLPADSLSNVGDIHVFTQDVASGLTWRDISDPSTTITAADAGDVALYIDRVGWTRVGNILRRGLTQTEVDARIADWAETGNTAAIPAGKLSNAPGLDRAAVDGRIVLNTPALVRAGVLDWAETGNTDPIPAAKLTNASSGGSGGADTVARAAAAAAQSTADTNAANIQTLGTQNNNLQRQATENAGAITTINNSLSNFSVFENYELVPAGFSGTTVPDTLALLLSGKRVNKTISRIAVTLSGTPVADIRRITNPTPPATDPALPFNQGTYALSGGVINLTFGTGAKSNLEEALGVAARAGAQFAFGTLRFEFTDNTVQIDRFHFGINNNAFIPTTVLPWARSGNTDAIPVAKLSNVPAARSWRLTTRTAGSSNAINTYALQTLDTELWVVAIGQATHEYTKFLLRLHLATSRLLIFDHRNPSTGGNDRTSLAMTAAISGNTLTLNRTGWINASSAPIVYAK